MLKLVSFFDLDNLYGRNGMIIRASVHDSYAWLPHVMAKKNWLCDKTTAKLQSFVVMDGYVCRGLAIIEDSPILWGRLPWADMWTNVRLEYREETIGQMLEVCQQMGIKDARMSCPIKDYSFAEALEVLGAHKLSGHDENGEETFCFSLEPTTELPKEAPRELIHIAN